MSKQPLLGALLIITLACTAFAQPTWAGPRDQPSPLPGWTHTPKYSDDTAAGLGLVLSGKSIDFGSPVIAEVDGNSADGKEVVIGGSDGRIYARHADGTALWEKNVPIAGCSANALIFGTPTVGALYGDGVPYVVIGYGSRNGGDKACDGGVVVFRGADGQQTWNFSQRAFDRITPEGPEDIYGVISAVALSDTEGDGKLELAFGGLDRNVYLLNYDGSVRWYYHAADTVWGTPLFMNIDSDPQLELIIGTDISANAGVIPPTQNGGYLYAFDTNVRASNRIQFQTGFIWRTFFDQVIYSSPLAGDLLASNAGLEIAVGSGCYWPVSDEDNKFGPWVKIFKPADGTVLQTLNAPGCTQSSPATGDIDDDGELELVINSRSPNGKGHVVAWDPTNPSPKWDKVTGDPNSGSNDGFVDMQSPVIADLDGNGSLEVLTSNFWSIHVLNGKDGSFLTCQSLSCGSQPALFAWYTLKGTPAVGDLNNDGKLDVVIGGGHILNSGKAHLYAWTNFAGVLNSPAGTQTAYSAPWPQFRRDAQANGLIVQLALTTSSPSVGTFIQTDETKQYQITIGSTDGSNVSPSAKVNDSNNIVSASMANATLTITVNTTGKAAGVYNATVDITVNGFPTKTIPITVQVVTNIFKVMLPAVIR